MHRLYAQRFQILLTLSADIRSVQLLQYLLVIIIGANDLILDGYHKSSSFGKSSSAFSLVFVS